MFRIICPDCKHNNDFKSQENKPTECYFCFNSISSSMEVIEIPDYETLQVSGLTLIFQSTSETIHIDTESCILGREHTGSEVMKKIMSSGKHVISRKHCSLQLSNNIYFVKDEDSFNGTFVGIDKKECKTSLLAVNDGDLLYLGKEAFLIKYVYKKSDEIETENQEKLKPAEVRLKKFRCNQGCGYETETYTEMCPKCFTCNSLIEVK
ncbi:MAG: FHA domain-containing protein [Bacteroidales bacterium]|nr:FHA domain-containing protein [Bacteroidales bacterium]